MKNLNFIYILFIFSLLFIFNQCSDDDYLTKDDLDGYVKEDSLNNYVEKDSLESYVKLDDLGGYVQSSDLSSYVEEDDLSDYASIKKKELTVYSYDWEEVGTSGEVGYGYEAENIDADITENSSVAVYFLTQGIHAELPLSVHYETYTRTVSSALTDGKITIIVTDDDLITTQPPEMSFEYYIFE